MLELNIDLAQRLHGSCLKFSTPTWHPYIFTALSTRLDRGCWGWGGECYVRGFSSTIQYCLSRWHPPTPPPTSWNLTCDFIRRLRKQFLSQSMEVRQRIHVWSVKLPEGLDNPVIPSHYSYISSHYSFIS